MPPNPHASRRASRKHRWGASCAFLVAAAALLGSCAGESHMSIKDRVDDACRIAYDATNGAISAGDVVRAVYSCSGELPK